MIYATNPEWLGTLTQPPKGEVWIMSEDGVCAASCVIGSLEDASGLVPVPENLEEIQRKFCAQGDDFKALYNSTAKCLAGKMYK